MGEKRDTVSLRRAFRRIVSPPPLCMLSTGTMVLARTLAPKDTKNDRNIHNATEARADVAILLKKMEKSGLRFDFGEGVLLP